MNRLLTAVVLLLAGADTTVPPVRKSVGWFTGNIFDNGTFLLSNHSNLRNASVGITDRMLPCCNDLAVSKNGTLPMTATSPYVGDFSPYADAGIEILINMGGRADAVEPMWARKEEFAQEMLALAVRWNFTGYTLDWEFGQVMNWTMFNETMTVAADLLHAHGKKIGVCVQSGCGDNIPGWAGATNPPCATLFRDMPWADKLTDMGTYVRQQLSRDEPRPLSCHHRPI